MCMKQEYSKALQECNNALARFPYNSALNFVQFKIAQIVNCRQGMQCNTNVTIYSPQFI